MGWRGLVCFILFCRLTYAFLPSHQTNLGSDHSEVEQADSSYTPSTGNAAAATSNHLLISSGVGQDLTEANTKQELASSETSRTFHIPKPFGPTRSHKFDLTDFGGKGDGVSDNTRAFQNAIYAVSTVSEKGGGQLFIPPGRYLTGCFNLTSHMTMYLAKNATLVAIPDPDLWPVLPPLPSYGRGREFPGPRHSSFIFGTNLTDVIITGEAGIIDGQGQPWWTWAQQKRLNFSRGPLIQFLWSTDVAVTNITLLNSPYWTIHTVYCQDVVIGSLDIQTPDDAPNAGGIFPDSSTRVLVESSTLRTGDDCISLKSGWDEYGIALNRSCSSVTVCGCQLRCTNCSALSIGSEMSGGVENVLYEDVHILESSAGFRLKTSPGRGGFVRGVKLKNVTMVKVGVAFSFLPMYGDHADEKYDPLALPLVADFTFQDVTGYLIETAGVLEGLANAPFEKINVTHVHLGLVEGGQGFSCANVKGTAKDVIPQMCEEFNPGGRPFSLQLL